MKNNLAIPIAIVIAGIIIGGALYFGNKNNTPSNQAQISPSNTDQSPKPSGISDKDHVLGNPDAGISMFVYSDLQCPYCKIFHATLKQVIEDYVKNGKIKIIFRHFPLSSIHPNAEKLAEGSECAAEIGGETKFWDFMDKIVELDTTDPLEAAKGISLDKNKFEECINSGKYAEKVENDFNSGTNAGVQGTPASIIVKNDKVIPIYGAMPYLETDPSLYQALSQEPGLKDILCNDSDQSCGIKIAIDKILAE